MGAQLAHFLLTPLIGLKRPLNRYAIAAYLKCQAKSAGLRALYQGKRMVN
jgi:hypothetical protein